MIGLAFVTLSILLVRLCPGTDPFGTVEELRRLENWKWAKFSTWVCIFFKRWYSLIDLFVKCSQTKYVYTPSPTTLSSTSQILEYLPLPLLLGNKCSMHFLWHEETHLPLLAVYFAVYLVVYFAAYFVVYFSVYFDVYFVVHFAVHFAVYFAVYFTIYFTIFWCTLFDIFRTNNFVSHFITSYNILTLLINWPRFRSIRGFPAVWTPGC